MPAYNDKFPWMSFRGNYKFFEDMMQNHNKVANIKSISDGLYDITLLDNRTLKVFICECYAYGIAEYYESVERLGHLDVVIINSNWCGYGMEVKLYCQRQHVGLFDIGGFMAALNIKDYWNYLTKEEKNYLKR